MENIMKRSLSLFLALVMVFGMVPVNAFAAETDAETEITSVMETEAQQAAPSESSEGETEAVVTTAETAAPAEAPTVAPTETATEATEVTETEASTEATEETEAEEVPATISSQWVTADFDLTNEELFRGYAEGILFGTIPAVYGNQAAAKLDETTRMAYNALKPELEKIASGDRTSAVISLGDQLGTLNFSDGSSGTYNADVSVDFPEDATIDSALLLQALLADMPYELYWFDKTTGIKTQRVSTSNGGIWYGFTFAVAGNYADTDCYITRDDGGKTYIATDGAKTSAVTNTAEKAQAVVDEVKADKNVKNDYDILLAYKEWICDAVSYNHDAADNGDFSEQIDPWQIIYAFDGDPNTDVVCEGYSKSFQYLCDLTEFYDEDTVCISVSGDMGGAHMWNIVHIDDKNYLVDVTNSDEDSIGEDGELFLAGATGTVDTKYTIVIDALNSVAYTYDQHTLDLWDNEDLTLSNTAYPIPEDTTGGDDSDPSTDTMTQKEFEEALNNASSVYNLTDSVTITENMQIPSGKHLNLASNGVLTIASGVTLIVNGKLGITVGKLMVKNSAKLVINGDYKLSSDGILIVESNAILVNNNSIYMGTESANLGSIIIDGELQNNGSIAVVGGTLTLNGTYVESSDHTTADGLVIRVTYNWQNAKIVGAEKIGKLTYQAHVSTEEELRNAIVKQSIDKRQIVYISSDITLSENLSIPAGIDVAVAFSATLTVPGGVTLTNNGSIQVLNGCSLIVNEGATLDNQNDIRVDSGCNLYCAGTFTGNQPSGDGQITIISMTQSALEAALESCDGLYELDKNVDITSNFTVPDGVTLWMNAGSSLNAAEGVTLTVDGSLIMEYAAVTIPDNATFIVNGHAVMNSSTLTVAEKALMVNNCYGIEINGSSVLTIDCELQNNGFIWLNSGTMNLNGDYVAWADNSETNSAVGIVLYNWFCAKLNGAEKIRNLYCRTEVYNTQMLKKAMEPQNCLFQDVHIGCDITLEEDVTIPCGVTLYVNPMDENGDSVTLTVPEGMTLTNEGVLNVYDGQLTVEKGATLDNQNSIWVVSNATLTCKGTFTGNQPYGNGSITGTSPDQDALEADLNYIRDNQITTEPYQLKNSLTLTRDLNANLSWDGGAANFVIPKGVTLTVPNGVTLTTGTLFNLGTIDVQEGGKLMVVDNFYLRGTLNCNGTITFVRTGNSTGGIILDEAYAYNLNATVAQSNLAMTYHLKENSLSQLNALLEKSDYGHYFIEVETDLTISDNVTIPADKEINMGYGYTLTVNKGKTLTNYGALYFLNCNVLENNGTIENDGYIYGNPMQTGSNGIITGLGMTDLVEPDHQTMSQEDFDAAMRSSGGFYELPSYTSVEISWDMAIPEGTVIWMNPGSSITVSNGATLTVNGQLTANSSTITVEEGATLVNNFVTSLGHGGKKYGAIIVNGKLVNNADVIVGSGNLNLNGTYEGSDGHVQYDWLHASITGEDQVDDLVYSTVVNTEAELRNAVVRKTGDQFVSIQGFITLTKDLTIPEGVTVDTGYSYDSSGATYQNGLIVNKKVTLTNKGVLNVVNGSKVEILSGGTLNNQGDIWVYEDNLLTGAGTYKGYVPCGNGNIDFAGVTPDTYSYTELVQDKEYAEANGESMSFDKQVTLKGNFDTSLGEYGEFHLNEGGKITVPSGTTLTVYSPMYVHDGATIEVQSGGKLVIDGALIVEDDGLVLIKKGGSYSVTDHDYASLNGAIANEGKTEVFLYGAWLENDNGWYLPEDREIEPISGVTAAQDQWMVFFARSYDFSKGEWVMNPVVPNVVKKGQYTIQKISSMEDQIIRHGEAYGEYFVKICSTGTVTERADQIVVTYGGKDYTLPFTFYDLPCGAYTTETPSADSVITDGNFEFATDKDNVIYLLPLDGYSLLPKDAQEDYISIGNIRLKYYTYNEDYDQYCNNGEDFVKVEELDKGGLKITINPDFVEYTQYDWKNFCIEWEAELLYPDGYNNQGHGGGVWCSPGAILEPVTTMNIDGDVYKFYENGGIVRDYFTGEYNEAGGEIWNLQVNAELPEGVAYDLESNTMTLTNASLSYIYAGCWFDGEGNMSNMPSQNFTLKLVGDNTLESSTISPLDLSNLNTTIAGNGSLTILAHNWEKNENWAFHGIQCFTNEGLTNCGNLTIQDSAKVSVCVDGKGCYPDDNGNACKADLHCIIGDMGTLTLKDNATLTTRVPDGEYVFVDENGEGMRYNVITGMNILVQDNATLNTDSLFFFDGQTFTQNGGTVNIEAPVSRSAYDNGEGGTDVWNPYEGIYASNGSTINLSGGVMNIYQASETDGSGYFYGITVTDEDTGNGSSLNITGGTLNITADAQDGVGIKVATSSVMNMSGGIVNLKNVYAVADNNRWTSITVFDPNNGDNTNGVLNLSGGTINAENFVWAFEMNMTGGQFNLKNNEKISLSEENQANNVDNSLLRARMYVTCGSISDGQLNITNGTLINRNNFGMDGGEIIIRNAMQEVTGLENQNYFPVNAGTLDIQTDEFCAIVNNGTFHQMGGVVKAEAKGVADAVYSDNQFLLNNGEMTLTGYNGIYAKDNGSTDENYKPLFQVSGGRLTIQAEQCGVCGTAPVDFTRASEWAQSAKVDITVTGDQGTGIYTEDEMIIHSDVELNINSQGMGICGDNARITVEDTPKVSIKAENGSAMWNRTGYETESGFTFNNVELTTEDYVPLTIESNGTDHYVNSNTLRIECGASITVNNWNELTDIMEEVEGIWYLNRNVTIGKSFTLPEYVMVKFGSITIPKGVTLTVGGNLAVYNSVHVTVEAGGKLTINKNCFVQFTDQSKLDVAAGATLTNKGYLIFNQNIGNPESGSGYTNVAGTFKQEKTGYTAANVHSFNKITGIDAKNINLNAAVYGVDEQGNTVPNGGDDVLDMFLKLYGENQFASGHMSFFGYEIKEDMTIPAGVSVECGVGIYGEENIVNTIEVDEGVTLTIEGQLHVEVVTVGIDQVTTQLVNRGTIVVNETGILNVTGHLFNGENGRIINNGGKIYPAATKVSISSVDGEKIYDVSDPETRAVLKVELDSEMLDCMEKNVTWTSSNSAIVDASQITQRDEDGNWLVPFTGTKLGKVTLTATANDGGKASAKITLNTTFINNGKLTAELTGTMVANSLQSNEMGQLKFYCDGVPVDVSRMEFEDTNSDYFKLDKEAGTIIGIRGTGSAKVTAKLAGDPKNRKVTVTVKGIESQVCDVKLYFNKYVGYDQDPIGDTLESGVDFTGNTITLHPAYISIYPTGHFWIPGKSEIKWTTSDSSVAKITANDDGSATVTIPEGANGMATITAAAKDSCKQQATVTIIVKDYTPKLRYGTVTMNTNLVEGYWLDLVESYGNTIDGMEVDDKGNVTYQGVTVVDDDRFDTVYGPYDENNPDAGYGWYIYLKDTEEPLKNGTYKVKLLVRSEKNPDGDELELKITVKNSLPKATVTQDGKFNLFYTDSKLPISVTVENECINEVEWTIDGLMLEKNALEWNVDNVRTNVVYDPDYTDYIVASGYQKPNTKITLNLHLEGYRVPVTTTFTVNTVLTKPTLRITPNSGTVYTELDGNSVMLPFEIYDETNDRVIELYEDTDYSYVGDDGETYSFPMLAWDSSDGAQILYRWGEGDCFYYENGLPTKSVTKKINFQCRNWTQDMTVSYKINVNKTLPTATLSDKTLTLNNNYPSYFMSTGISCSEEITSIDFDFEQNSNFVLSYAEGKIVVEFNCRFNGSFPVPPAAGKYTIKATPYIRGTSETGTGVPLKDVTLTVNVVNTKPTVKASTTMKLNTNFTAHEASTAVTTNQDNIKVYDFTEFKATKNTDEAQKIRVWFENGEVKAEFTDPKNLPKAGTYTFQASPYVSYNSNPNGSHDGIGDFTNVTVSVKVESTAPTVKLSSTAVKLNTYFVEDGVSSESASVAPTLTNKTGIDMKIVNFRVDSVDGDLLEEADQSKVTLYYDEEGEVLTATLRTNKADKKGISFKLYPVVEYADGATETLSTSVTLKVTPYDGGAPTATMSSSGKLDTLNRSTGITYTVTKLGNALGAIDEDSLVLVDAQTGEELVNEDGESLFDVKLGEPNAKGQQTIVLKLKKGQDYEVNTYKAKLRFDINGRPAQPYSLSLKVTQTTLKVSVTSGTSQFYQSEGMLWFTLKITSPENATFDYIEVNAGKTSKELLTAMAYDEEEGYVWDCESEYWYYVNFFSGPLANPGALKAGKSYNLYLDVYPVGCATNKPTTVKVTVKVNK